MSERPAEARPRSRRVAWIAAGVAVPVVLLVGILAGSPPAGTRAADSPLLGKPAPAIEAQTIGGETVRLDDLRGRWVLVNFFATWCIPCREEHPELVRFDNRHRLADDAEVVGVIYDDNVGAVRDFLAKHGGDWPMLVDPNGRIALDFGVAGVPESYLLSPDGVVAAKVIGGIRAQALDDLLAQVKAGTPPIR